MKLLSNRQSSSIIFPVMFLPALMLLIHPYAFASRCRACPDLTPCEAYGRAKAVFVGRAISGEELKWDSVGGGKKWIQLVGKVRFIVEQSFKGVHGNEIEVIAWDRECGFGPFVKGERYLLYLDGNYNGVFSEDICSRSTHISGADEDLKFLSSLTSKTCGPRLYGTVGDLDRKYVIGEKRTRTIPRVGIPGITITATDNQGGVLKAITNQEGAYEFSGILPGVEYTVRAEMPGHFYQGSERTVRIDACACARQDFSAIYNGSISGRVSFPDGKPVAWADISIVRADEKISSLQTRVSSTLTDWEGRYVLEQAPIGNLLIGVNITGAPAKDYPYPPTWYPNADTRQAASVIELGPGQKLSGYDLIVPRRLAERTIEGTVLWPDGRPAVEAFVYLSPSAQPGQGSGELIYTDEQGRFKITGYEGIAYYVVVSGALNRDKPYALRKSYYAEPPLVELNQENITGFKLVLTWDEAALDDFFKKKREQ